MIQRMIHTIKQDMVLVIAWILAVLSMLLVHPSKAYLEYIDWRSLGILWSLMIIMQMLQDHAVFEYLGHRLLLRTHFVWQLVAVLVGLCFFSSMFITNDVALITFVPFAIMLLKQCKKEDNIIMVVVLQTIAANLGSMMMPVGNPQNLYLFGLQDMTVWEFVQLMLPYAAVSLGLILITMLFVRGKSDSIDIELEQARGIGSRKVVVIYLMLFVLALLTVARIIPFCILVVMVLAVTLICDAGVIRKVDYGLLMTFVGFFLFTGNLGRYAPVREFLQTMVDGHELMAGIAVSQIISNVPAALLLSKFTSDIPALIISVNLGGLGTLIASMASLISFKLYARTTGAKKASYMAMFTVVSIVYLLVLCGLFRWIRG